MKAFRSLPRNDPAEFCREWKKLLRIQALNSPNTGIVQDVSTKCTRNVCITALSMVKMQRDHTHKCVTSNVKTSHDINMLLMRHVALSVRHAALSLRHVVLCVHACALRADTYGVATISRLLKIIGLSCKRAL